MHNITAKIDSIADIVEAKGLIKEAYELDKIADAINAGVYHNVNMFLNNILKKIGIKHLPTPYEAAKMLAGASAQSLGDLAALFSTFMLPPPPAVHAKASGETDAVEGGVLDRDWATKDRPSGFPMDYRDYGSTLTFSRLPREERELVPAYASIVKEISERKPGANMPSPQEIRSEIDRLIGEIENAPIKNDPRKIRL